MVESLWHRNGGAAVDRGVYWIAVHDVRQRHGLQVNLVDARGTKNVPGRKSDVQECQWLLKLHTYGLLRSCFLPSPEIHRVRTVWRRGISTSRTRGGASSICRRR